jgi:UrcA family protein
MNHFAFAITAVAAAGLLGTAAIASPVVRTAAVSHADLDLTTASGQSRLQDRIELAARRVCGTADARDLSAHASMHRCRTAARTDAFGKVKTAVATATANQRVALRVQVGN